MDPNIDKSPALALPSPSAEQSGQLDSFGTSGGHHSPEMGPSGAETHSGLSQPASSAQPAVLPQLPQNAAQLPPAQATDLTAAPIPQATDDASTSAIDEEWINKAKSIVERTKNDPYIESKELGKAKADYLRIRYNKQVKVVEDAPR